MFSEHILCIPLENHEDGSSHLFSRKVGSTPIKELWQWQGCQGQQGLPGLTWQPRLAILPRLSFKRVTEAERNKIHPLFSISSRSINLSKIQLTNRQNINIYGQIFKLFWKGKEPFHSNLVFDEDFFQCS